MKQVYACLLGEWVNLTENDGKIMYRLNEFVDPNTWLSEGGAFYVNCNPPTSVYDGYEKVKILHNDHLYTIHPAFIQILE